MKLHMIAKLMLSGVMVLVAALQPARAATEYYPPLSSQIDMSSMPDDIAQSSSTPGNPSIGDGLRVKSFLYSEIQDEAGVDVGARINLKLVVVPQGVSLDIPGLGGVMSLALIPGEFDAEAVVRENHAAAPTEDYPLILTITPTSAKFALQFKTDVLKPVHETTYEPYTSSPPTPQIELGAGIKIVIKYSWDGDADIQILDDAGLRPTLSLNTPVAIGETGIVLEVKDAEIDLSRTSSAAGLPPNWIGVRFGKLALNFTNGLKVPAVEHGPGSLPPPPQMVGVVVTDFTVGSGGISGGICGPLSAAPTIPLFDANFQLKSMCITLQEGSLTAGEVKGTLSEFPYFDTAVDLSLALSMDGNFKVGLSQTDPAHPASAIDLEIPSVLVYHLEALSIERKDGTYLWNTSGTLNIDAISTQAEDAIRVNGLTITSDGQVRLDGGWLTLPGKKTIDFNGFNLELAEIGFGSEDPAAGGKSWVGFTGGVELVGDLGASAKFKKLQYLWGSGGGGTDVKLQGVEVAFRKPGAVAFHGALDYFDDPVTHDKGFAGKVAVNIEAVRLAIDGRLVVGKARPPGQDPFAFFFVDLAASLPAGIPLFSNVSLYGFTGLFSYQMSPNIVAFTTPVKWFEAHLAATNMLAVPTGHPAAPWRTQDGALALGAGVIVGTSADDGFVVNAKLALMIALPGPIVMLNGAANVVKERGALLDSTNRPNFTAVAIYDGSLNTFMINIGAYYSVVDLINVEGQAEAFFDLADPNNWHVWIGKDQPEERRIRAEVLGFLKANSYFMIDSTAFAQGAGGGYDGRWKFGPLKVVLSSTMGYDMKLFWRPMQVWGALGVRGEFELKAFGIGVGLAANADLDGQSPHPLEAKGDFKVKIKLPWPLPDPSATVHLEWKRERDKEPLPELVGLFSIEPRKGGTSFVPETLSASGDSSRAALPTGIPLNSLCRPGESVLKPDQHEIDCKRPLVPLDVLAVAAFQRDVNDINNLGFGNPSSPLKLDVINDASFQYDLNNFEILQAEKTGSSALTFGAPLPGLYGAWPALAGGADTSALSLRVLSRNPIDVYQYSQSLFYQNGMEGWTEWAVDTYGPQYCFDGQAAGLFKTSLATATSTGDWKCPLPPGLLSGDDFILPPYSAFLFNVDTDVTPNVPTGNVHDRVYRNYSIFHTEGPPLALDPYVEITSPADNRRPHYRAYDIGVRFNESYMDLMYRRPGQLFQVQLLDDNDLPVRTATAPVPIATDWDLAATHVPRATEDDWLQFLRDHGVPVDTLVPRDDRVFGRVSLTGAIRGGERYKVRLWFEDPHLASDARLTDSDWLAANPIRFQTGNRVVVYEFPLLTSKFDTFTQLVQSYPHDYVEVAVPGANLTQLATLAAAAARPTPLSAAPLTNASSTELAHFLRHAMSPSGPEDVAPAEVDKWIRRAPGYSGKPERMSDDEKRALRESWSAALGAYEEIDKALDLESKRRPLPERFEVRALKDGASTVGLLIEAPEPLDFTRIHLLTWRAGFPLALPVIVPNRDNTRFFVFHVSGGAVQPWPDDVHGLGFVLAKVVGDRYPVLRSASPGNFEATAIFVNLPADRFVPEAP